MHSATLALAEMSNAVLADPFSSARPWGQRAATLCHCVFSAQAQELHRLPLCAKRQKLIFFASSFPFSYDGIFSLILSVRSAGDCRF